MTVYSMKVLFRYEFDRPTGAGRQLFRILPAQIAGKQSLLRADVKISPVPLETDEFTDFFGNRVIEMIVPAGMTAVEFVLDAQVERLEQDIGLDISAPLARLAREIALHRGIEAHSPHHFLSPTPRIPAIPEVTEFARAATKGAVTTREALESLGLAINKAMTFDSAATDVHTPAAEAFKIRRGVCQDFAQIMVSALRGLRIPAAYVGGYLRTLPPPGQARLVGADATHAWVRAWCGTETGWVDYDPTNACFALGDHIDIGFGRDYDDVAPVTGMMRMDGGQKGTHSVDIEDISLQPRPGRVWADPELDPSAAHHDAAPTAVTGLKPDAETVAAPEDSDEPEGIAQVIIEDPAEEGA